MTPNPAQYTCAHFSGNISPGELVRAPKGTEAIYVVVSTPTSAQRMLHSIAHGAGALITQEVIRGHTTAGESVTLLRVRVVTSGTPYREKTDAKI